MSEQTSTPYQQPHAAIADIIDAPPTPATSLCPRQKWLALMSLPSLPPIDELAREELKLAGLRFHPQTRDRSRGGHFTGMELVHLKEEGRRAHVTGFPEGARLRRPRWSPDSAYIVLTIMTDEGGELWLVDVEAATARRLAGPILHALVNAPYRWTPEGHKLILSIAPPDNPEPPAAPSVPPGPVIEENMGQRTPARTYQDLLSNPHDEALFEHHVRSQLAIMDLDGNMELLGEPALFLRSSPSPDGLYMLVETLHRPFSYQFPLGRFPRKLEVWDISGTKIADVADLPLADDIPSRFSAVRKGRRSVGWRQDAPATLKWFEAQDDGDPDKDVPIRDHLYFQAAPFDAEPVLALETATRLSNVIWGNGQLAMVTEAWWQTRRMKVWMIAPDDPQTEPKILFDRTWEDRYNDPGQPMLKELPTGHLVMRITEDGKHVYFAGAGASPEGNRPFVDLRNIETGDTKRLWRSEAPYFTSPVDFLDEACNLLMVRRESQEEAPNYFVLDLRDDSLKQLTHYPHPTPMLKGLNKELIRYERYDGVKLTGTLYTPAGYDPERDGPRPTLLWAYPREFKSADAAGQVRDSPYRFVRVGWWSPLLWLNRGFVVLDDPAMPIVGEDDAEPNDTYVEQLVGSARAAVEHLAERGITDPQRVGIGGHSYGAFMTANLLAHSDIFAAGIARSGAYNRTLTPFGFQAEERTLWQTPETYAAMSPFMHADKITAPILLIHGAMDNNSGTYPMQSERFYQALKGHGATARLVMLPYESHGYQARESIMHMAWEMDRWLQTYVVERKTEGQED